MTRNIPHAQLTPGNAEISTADTGWEPRRRRRRFGSFLSCVVMPVMLAAAYLYGMALDQFISEFRFTVRQQAPLRGDGTGPNPLAGGNPLMALIVDSEVVVQYLKSRQILDDIAERLDLERIYARPEADWWFRLRPAAPMEDRLRHWRRVVEPYFDLTSGVVTVRVHAFTPEDARQVATAALELAEKLVNDMARRSARDVLAFAESEVSAAEVRLKSVHASLAEYRNANAVLFPQLQAATTGGVEGRLRDSLGEARSAYNALLAEGVSRNAPQMRALQARIAAVEAELREVVAQMARRQDGGTANASLATVLRDYSALEAEERLASSLYERALTNLQSARALATQQLVYLNAFVRPAQPERSMYPLRWQLMLQALVICLVLWALGLLIVRGIRDQME